MSRGAAAVSPALGTSSPPFDEMQALVTRHCLSKEVPAAAEACIVILLHCARE
jgi:hypothetical protein